MIKNSENSYGVVAKVFHWGLFLMLSFTVVAGNILVSMPKGPEKFEAIGMHKSFGAVILILVLLRLLWRLINTVPKDPAGSDPQLNRMAHGMHIALYGLMFAQPISGILMSQAAGYPVQFFGLFEFPLLLDKNPALGELFHTAHATLWMVLGFAMIGHAGAALYHHFIRKDGVLKRMAFGKREAGAD